MRGCLAHADELRSGVLLDSQNARAEDDGQDAPRPSGSTHRDGRTFAGPKEVLAGFNLIEAEDIDEAVRIAAEFPWTRTGWWICVRSGTSKRCAGR
jgi:hypothetical protein